MATRIRELKAKQELPRDHVVVVKLGPGNFEVSGTAGLGPKAAYCSATAFVDQYSALARAEDFGREHRLKCIYVKGFKPHPQGN